jgi:hypothetical protein
VGKAKVANIGVRMSNQFDPIPESDVKNCLTLARAARDGPRAADDGAKYSAASLASLSYE